MKTILSKVKFMLIAMMLLVGVTAVFADDGSTDPLITLNVKAGTLYKMIPESRRSKITNLKLTGQLNTEDIDIICDMGKSTYFPEATYDGNLQYLDIEDAIFDNSVSRDKTLWRMDRLRSVKLPKNLTEIGHEFLGDCDNLVSVKLPPALEKIESDAFYGSGNITSIKLDRDNPYYYSEDSVLFNRDKTEIIFAVNLISYTVPNSVLRIGENSFSNNCKGLKSLFLPSGLEEIGDHAFYGCESLNSLTLPLGLKKIGKAAFMLCESLNSLTLPSGLQKIEDHTFCLCCGLTSISLPSGLKEIGIGAFSGCESLKSISLPSELTKIGDSAFRDCYGFDSSLLLPSKLTEIGSLAFYYTSFNPIYACMPTPPAIQDDSFSFYEKRYGTLYVPVNSYQDYFFSDEWGNFANIKTFEPTSVEPVFTADDASETSRYTIGGQRQDNPVKGLNIVKMNDGSVKKIMVK